MAQTGGILEGLFSSPRKQRRFFIFSALVLLAGIIAILLATVFRGTGNAYPDKFSNKPAQLNHPQKPVSTSEDQISLMRDFLQTAVARTDLKRAYWLVGPDLRGGLTMKQWLGGTIPVLYYQATNARTAVFEVNLHAKPGTETRPSLLFYVGLKRQGGKPNGRWLVNYFEPNWQAPVPMAPG